MARSTTFFSKQFGHVTAMRDPSLPGSITFRMEDWGGFDILQAIINSVSVSAQGNYQFIHTLGGNIFVYVFGDRIGNVSISGKAFEGTCGGFLGNAFRGSKAGIERVLDYYWAERVAGRQTPIKVTIGAGTVLVGYITGIKATSIDEASRIFDFRIDMATILNRPRAKGKAGSLPAPAPAPDGGGGGTSEPTTPYPEPTDSPGDDGGYGSTDVTSPVTGNDYDTIDTGAGYVIDPTTTVLE